MVKAMDCGIVVSEFVLQSRYYVHFRAIRGYEPPYPPSYGLNSTTTVLQGEWLWHKITYKIWYAINKETKETNVIPRTFVQKCILPYGDEWVYAIAWNSLELTLIFRTFWIIMMQSSKCFFSLYRGILNGCKSYLPSPSARGGYDTRSIFKWSLTGLIQSFLSPRLVASPRLKNLVYPTTYP